MRKVVLAALVLAFLVGLSPLAADPVITRGIDVFTTTDSGTTFYSFADNPIPAGFFCKRSKPFAGRVSFKGLPLEAVGSLRGSDTIIERLDDAQFDANGTAVTRIRVRALSLVSVAPLKTACGAFHVYVSLAGEQRMTTMRIVRTEAGGGSFYAPLAIDAKLTFIPVRQVKGRTIRPLELTASINLPRCDALELLGPAAGQADRLRRRRHQRRFDSGYPAARHLELRTGLVAERLCEQGRGLPFRQASLRAADLSRRGRRATLHRADLRLLDLPVPVG
jgi:hypothetical protein